MIFKVIVIGLLTWQLIKLVTKRKEKPSEQTTYIVIPSEATGKNPYLLNGPPPSYDAALPSK